MGCYIFLLFGGGFFYLYLSGVPVRHTCSIDIFDHDDHIFADGMRVSRTIGARAVTLLYIYMPV